MYRFVAYEDEVREDTWHVQKHDDDGCITDDIADVRFEGKYAAKYAHEYADWQNHKLQEVTFDKPRLIKR